MATRPAPQPEAEASSVSSAAQPARQEPAGSAVPPPPQQSSPLHGAERPEWPMPTRPAPRPEAEASSASSERRQQPMAPREGVRTNNVCCGHDYLPRRYEQWRNLGRGRSSSPEWPLPDTHTASSSLYPGMSGHRRLRSGIQRAWSMEPWLEEKFARWAPTCAAAAAVDQALAAATAALA